MACSAGRMLARLEQEEYSSRRRFADGFSRELAKEEGDGASGEIATHTRSVARFGYAAKPATAREPRPFLASLPADDDERAGKVTVRYPRGAQAEKELHGEATERLMRARTPEDALAVVLRLLARTAAGRHGGLPGADRQGVYEPQELAGSKVLAKLARRVAPPRSRSTWPSRRQSASAASRHGTNSRRQSSPSSARSSPQAKPSAAPAASSRSRQPRMPPRSTAASSTQANASSSGAARRTRSATLTRSRSHDPSAPTTNLNNRRDADASFDPQVGRDAKVGVVLSVAKLSPGQERYYERSVAERS